MVDNLRLCKVGLPTEARSRARRAKVGAEGETRARSRGRRPTRRPPSRFALWWTTFASARLACQPKLARVPGERRLVRKGGLVPEAEAEGRRDVHLRASRYGGQPSPLQGWLANRSSHACQASEGWCGRGDSCPKPREKADATSTFALRAMVDNLRLCKVGLPTEARTRARRAKVGAEGETRARSRAEGRRDVHLRASRYGGQPSPLQRVGCQPKLARVPRRAKVGAEGGTRARQAEAEGRGDVHLRASRYGGRPSPSARLACQPKLERVPRRAKVGAEGETRARSRGRRPTRRPPFALRAMVDNLRLCRLARQPKLARVPGERRLVRKGRWVPEAEAEGRRDVHLRASRYGGQPSPLQGWLANRSSLRARGSEGWCEGGLNPHALTSASPSSWCVCQFRHFRVPHEG